MRGKMSKARVPKPVATIILFRTINPRNFPKIHLGGARKVRPCMLAIDNPLFI